MRPLRPRRHSLTANTARSVFNSTFAASYPVSASPRTHTPSQSSLRDDKVTIGEGHKELRLKLFRRRDLASYLKQNANNTVANFCTFLYKVYYKAWIKFRVFAVAVPSCGSCCLCGWTIAGAQCVTIDFAHIGPCVKWLMHDRCLRLRSSPATIRRVLSFRIRVTKFRRQFINADHQTASLPPAVRR